MQDPSSRPSDTESIRLTQFAHGAGCGCKVSPAVLREIIGDAHSTPFPGLLVGNDTADDAAVMDLGNGRAIISTTDFFMPIVDDAHSFGAIASANAISDIYAMGGRPLMAIAILGWPVDKLPAAVAAEVLNGARAICAEAQIPLAGGHTIDSPEPIFGLAVTGEVEVQHLKRNSTARAGHLIYLTKPLGAGIITTAAKRAQADAPDVQQAVAQMCRLNSVGYPLGHLQGVSAMTDVTGFGLLGHLIEMCEGAGISARIRSANVPLLPGLDTYIDRFIYPDMTMRNFQAYGHKVSTLNARQLFTLCDPQTSGGLLVAVHPDSVHDFMGFCRIDEVEPTLIGEFVERGEKVVDVG
jgi:selenide,water dikinase